GISASVNASQPYRVGLTQLGVGSAIAKGPRVMRPERATWLGSTRRVYEASRKKGSFMKPHTDSKCGVCATSQFERNNYFYGKQFTVRDLQQEQSYFNDKRYLINRMVLGWGVVCGLDVYWDSSKRKIVVKPGMALDCCGHEIVVCEDQYLSLDDNDDDCCFEQDQKRVGKFVLCLEYNDCFSEPVDLPPAGCDDKGKTEYNRIRDTFRLRLKNWDDACPKEPPDGISCPSDYKHDTDG